MKKRGFTLIELLAVIVILAIIALIATPIVMNLIENSRKGAAERSAENYLRAVETAVATERLDGKTLNGDYTIQSDGSICPVSGCGQDNVDKVAIDMNGNKPTSGTIVIENGLVTTESTMTFTDNYKVSYDSTKGSYVASKEEAEGNTITTVYRWSEEEIKIGDTITDTTRFTTDPSTLGKDVYLKHALENNVVTEAWVCTVINDDETCLKGGSAESYTENELILASLYDLGFDCFNYGSDAGCPVGSASFYTMSDGFAFVNSESVSCTVSAEGISNCLSQ